MISFHDLFNKIPYFLDQRNLDLIPSTSSKFFYFINKKSSRSFQFSIKKIKTKKNPQIPDLASYFFEFQKRKKERKKKQKTKLGPDPTSPFLFAVEYDPTPPPLFFDSQTHFALFFALSSSTRL